MKIVALCLNNFGDILLTFEPLALLKKHFPNSQIIFLCKNPEVAKLSFDVSQAEKEDNFFLSIKILSQADLVLDFSNNLRTFAFKICLPEKKWLVFPKNRFQKFLLVNFKIKPKNYTEIPFRYCFFLAKKLALKFNPLHKSGFSFEIPKPKLVFEEQSQDFPLPKNFVVLGIGATKNTKIWQNYKKLAQLIFEQKGLKSVLLGFPSELEKAGFIQNNLPNFVLMAETNIFDFMKVIEKADFIVCNDSLVMHASRLLGKRFFAIFGSTVREFGFWVDCENGTLIENKNIDCRPCAKSGFEKCPKTYFKCLKEILAEEVLSFIEKKN